MGGTNDLGRLVLACALLAAACDVPPSRTLLPDAAGRGGCLPDEETCGPRETCGHHEGEPRCACRAGYEGDADACAVPCEAPAAPVAPSDARFVGPGGVDPDDCSGGDREHPWATVKRPQGNGCLRPGMAVYLLEGRYGARDLFGPALSVSGAAEEPLWIGADPDAAPARTGARPVQIFGATTVTASWVILDGLEIVQRGREVGLTLAGDHLQLRNSFVHGEVDEASWVPSRGGADCVKILSEIARDGTRARTHDILVVDNEIARCPEDAIDVTGAVDVVYRGNHIHHAAFLQAKGGTENLLVEGNLLHDLEHGFAGFGMACPDYCGSPLQPTLEVERRFVARNVTIRNNRLQRVGGHAFVANGWVDVHIENNTLADVGESALVLDRAGFQFFDEEALSWCEADTTRGCEPCEGVGLTACTKITFASRALSFENNIVTNAANPLVDVRASAGGHRFAHNIFQASSAPARFQEGDRPLGIDELEGEANLDTDPRLRDVPAGDLGLRADSPAIDAASELGLCTDSVGTARRAPPDVGALEFVAP